MRSLLVLNSREIKNYIMSKLSFKPIKKNYRLCSLKQFVGNGKLQINENTIQFSSKSVEVLVEKENGEKYKLFCDTFVSNGIKTEYINESFFYMKS